MSLTDFKLSYRAGWHLTRDSPASASWMLELEGGTTGLCEIRTVLNIKAKLLLQLKKKLMAGEMALWLRCFLHKRGDLNSVPRTYIKGDGKNQLHKVDL